MNPAIKQHMGVYLPAHETHMSQWMSVRMVSHPREMVDGKGTYQYHKLQAALQHVRRWDVAVDVGAHCGLWSMHLAKKFLDVHAFEPVPLHRECFALNTSGRAGVHMHPVALGVTEETVRFHTTHTSSGDSWVDKDNGELEVQVRRMDDELANVDHVDFIKLDCEGFELFALQGGIELIKRSKPCIIVEQKPGRATKYGLGQTDAVPYLQGLGAVLRAEMSGDFIMSWPVA